jgi:hypothetical protein
LVVKMFHYAIALWVEHHRHDELNPYLIAEGSSAAYSDRRTGVPWLKRLPPTGTTNGETHAPIRAVTQLLVVVLNGTTSAQGVEQLVWPLYGELGEA